MRRPKIDCRNLVKLSGIKYIKDKDDSLFIACPTVDCEAYCIRVTQHGFYSFETGIRGDVYGLANVIISSNGEIELCRKIIDLKCELQDKVAEMLSSK